MFARALRIAAVSLAVAAVVALVGYSYRSTLTPPAMTGVAVASRNVAIEATNQIGPADVVTVRRVLAPDASWIVVYVAGSGGVPGARVGAVTVPAGEHLDVRVPLTSHIAMSQKLVAVLHVDRGVRGRFEFDTARFDASPDKPYYVSGSEVRAPFTKDVLVTPLLSTGGGAPGGLSVAAGSVALDVADRLTIIDRLVVDRVLAPGPAWLAVYLIGDDGVPSRRVGLAHVPAGESTGVTVLIDPGESLTEKLLVALQADLGAANVFEFDPAKPADGVDRPYVVDGVELSAPVLVRGYGMAEDNTVGGMGGGMSGTP